MQLGDPARQATPRADATLKELRMTDTYEVLVTLLKEPSGTVRRLVAADGVTPQDLVPELKEGADDPYSTERVPLDTTLLPAQGRAQRVRRYVSAPVDLVAESLADPGLPPVWAYDPTKATASDGGLRVRHDKGGRVLTVQLAVDTETVGDTRIVTWTHTALDTQYAGQRLPYDRFEVTPAPGGADIVRTSGRRTYGVLGRLAAPFTDRFVGWGMLHTMQTITFGIADRQPTLSQRASSSVTASAIDPSRLRGVQPSLRTHSEVQPAQANTRSPSRTSPVGRQSQRSRHGSCLRERGMAPSWRTAWPRAADVVPNRLDRSGRPGHGQGGVDRAQPVELVDQGAGGRHHRDVAGLGAGDEVVEREPLGRRRSKVSA